MNFGVLNFPLPLIGAELGSLLKYHVGVEKVTVISDRNGGRSMVISKEECLPCCGSPFSGACES